MKQAATDVEPHSEAELARSRGGSHAISTELRRAILDGRYGFNEKLPPERQLAAAYGAARGTVREALRQLEDMNLVKRRVGSGTFVKYRKEMDHDAIATLTSPLELIDVRLGIEAEMVRLAVLHASGRHLEDLRTALERLEAVGDDGEEFTLADEAFHLALAECTQNPLMVWLYQHINDVRTHAQWSGMKDKILTRPRIRDYNDQHRRLYDAIVNRDATEAVQVMKEHLSKARSDLLGASPS
jgi:DNA-binding FadR family transcriptional regulator